MSYNDLVIALIFGVGICISLVDMAYQRYTTGHVDQKAAFQWVWRTVMAAVLFFLAHAAYLLVISRQ